MKKLIFTVMALVACHTMQAQYFCSENGAQLHYVNYDGSGQSVSNETATVVNVSNEGSMKRAQYLTKIVNNKAKNNTSYTLFDWSYDGTNTVCMEDLAYGPYIKGNSDPEKYDTAARTVYREEMKYEGDNSFTLSNEAKPGMTMPDRSFSAILNSLRNEINVSGAAYMGTEVVSTTAGKFNCLKISYLHRKKVVLKTTTWRVTEWYAVGVGLVKSEAYDTKGRLAAKTLLIKVVK